MSSLMAGSFADPAPARADFARRNVPLIGLHMGAGLFNPARLERYLALAFEAEVTPVVVITNSFEI